MNETRDDSAYFESWSTSGQYHLHPRATVSAMVILVTSIIGNGLVMAAFVRDRRLRVAFNSLVVAMATADIIMSSILICEILSLSIHQFVFSETPVLCRLLSVLVNAVPTEQLIINHMMCHDRHKAFVRRLTYSQHNNEVLRLGVSCIFSIAVSFLFTDIIIIVEQEQFLSCYFPDRPFVVSRMIFFHGALLLILALSVIYIIVDFRKQRKKRPYFIRLGLDTEPGLDSCFETRTSSQCLIPRSPVHVFRDNKISSYPEAKHPNREYQDGDRRSATFTLKSEPTTKTSLFNKPSVHKEKKIIKSEYLKELRFSIEMSQQKYGITNLCQRNEGVVENSLKLTGLVEERRADKLPRPVTSNIINSRPEKKVLAKRSLIFDRCKSETRNNAGTCTFQPCAVVCNGTQCLHNETRLGPTQGIDYDGMDKLEEEGLSNRQDEWPHSSCSFSEDDIRDLPMPRLKPCTDSLHTLKSCISISEETTNFGVAHFINPDEEEKVEDENIVEKEEETQIAIFTASCGVLSVSSYQGDGAALPVTEFQDYNELIKIESARQSGENLGNIGSFSNSTNNDRHQKHSKEKIANLACNESEFSSHNSSQARKDNERVESLQVQDKSNNGVQNESEQNSPESRDNTIGCNKNRSLNYDFHQTLADRNKRTRNSSIADDSRHKTTEKILNESKAALIKEAIEATDCIEYLKMSVCQEDIEVALKDWITFYNIRCTSPEHEAEVLTFSHQVSPTRPLQQLGGVQFNIHNVKTSDEVKISTVREEFLDEAETGITINSIRSAIKSCAPNQETSLTIEIKECGDNLRANSENDSRLHNSSSLNKEEDLLPNYKEVTYLPHTASNQAQYSDESKESSVQQNSTHQLIGSHIESSISLSPCNSDHTSMHCPINIVDSNLDEDNASMKNNQLMLNLTYGKALLASELTQNLYLGAEQRKGFDELDLDSPSVTNINLENNDTGVTADDRCFAQISPRSSIQIFESLSISRRAYLSELGLYQDIMTGHVDLKEDLLQREECPQCPYCVEKEKSRCEEHLSEISSSEASSMAEIFISDLDRPTSSALLSDTKLKHLKFLADFCSNNMALSEQRKLKARQHSNTSCNENSTHSSLFVIDNYDDYGFELRKTTKSSWKTVMNKFGKYLNFERMKSYDAELSLLVSLLLISLLQIFCWFPITVLYMYFNFKSFPYSIDAQEIHYIILWCLRMAIQPFIYAYYSKCFRMNFIYFLCCGFYYCRH